MSRRYPNSTGRVFLGAAVSVFLFLAAGCETDNSSAKVKEAEAAPPSDSPASLQSKVDAKYPSGLRTTGLKAEVVIRFTVDKTGKVGDVGVVTSTDERFNQSALDAVRQWKFKPAIKDGQPAAVSLEVPIRFTLAQP